MQTFASTPLHQKESRDFSIDRYQRLRSVVESYSDVKTHEEFPQFLKNFARLMAEAGVGNRFGVFLLHRHFLPKRGTLPIERFVSWGSSLDPALVTKMESGEGTTYAPSRWAYEPQLNLFAAIEYSTDPAVLREWWFILSKPQLMLRLADLFGASALSGTLGFAVAARSSLLKNPGDHFVEISDVEQEASVVRLDSELGLPSPRIIPTMWVPTVSCWCKPQVECASICGGYGSDDHYELDHWPVDIGDHKLVPCV